MTEPMTTEVDHSTPTPWEGVRFQPSVALGLLVYFGYLAIFYATWKINDVDYDTIGDTVESTKLHYAMPTLLGCAFLVVAISVLGWWRITLFDSFRSGPKWAWIGPIAMFLLAVASFAGVTWGNVSSSLLMSVRPRRDRGGLRRGDDHARRPPRRAADQPQRGHGLALQHTRVRRSARPQRAVRAIGAARQLVQLVFTFLVGSLLWSIRRLSGTLLLCMFLHGFWDSSVFLPGATGDDPFPLSTLIYVIGIVCAIAVLRKNRGIYVR